MTELDDQDLWEDLQASLAEFKVTLLIGPRYCGKTRLAERLEVAESHWFDLGDPLDQARLERGRDLLAELRGLVVIDGFEREPALLPLLLELATAWGGPSRFLLVGACSPLLKRQLGESSSAKLHVLEMGALSRRELGIEGLDRLWLRGGLPESYFAASDEESVLYRERILQTMLRRDLPSLGFEMPVPRLQSFLMKVARHHGEAWNSSAVAKAVGVSHPTARAYLDLFSDTGMLRKLPPLAVEGTKRMVKAPRVYVRDSGLLHALLEIGTMEELESNDLRDRSWKGFALEQLVSEFRLRTEEMFFWATHGGADLDLVIERSGKRFGFEFKVTEKPGVTHSMTIAKADLGLEQVFLVYPGEKSFGLREGMEAVGMAGSLDRATLSR